MASLKEMKQIVRGDNGGNSRIKRLVSSVFRRTVLEFWV